MLGIFPAADTALAAGDPYPCLGGFVFREAYPGDATCVTPEARQQAANDNAYGPDRVDPDGAYGPNSCLSPYVWRQARDGDVVCVTTTTRDETHRDNQLAPDRTARLKVWTGTYEGRLAIGGSHFNFGEVRIIVARSDGSSPWNRWRHTEKTSYPGYGFGMKTTLLPCEGQPNGYVQAYDQVSKRWSYRVPVRLDCATY